MDLSTQYLGFSLPHPIVPGASPLTSQLDMVRRLEDAGAPMLILPSLFEEQLVREELASQRAIDTTSESHAESQHYFAESIDYPFGPDEYLEHLRCVKEMVRIPVLGSLNGTSPGGWLKYASLMQSAGADGLELNLYQVAQNVHVSGAEVEEKFLDVVRAVREAVTIPLAVKLSPFFSSLPHFAMQLDRLGVDAIVLFNRFYEPEIDPERLEMTSTIHLSDHRELPMRLRWIGMLFGEIRAALAVTGGVHTVTDVVKSVMAGANAVQTVAALLKHGPGHLRELHGALDRWLTQFEYESLSQMLGSMSLLRTPQPEAYERAQYVKILQTWSPL